MNFDGTKSNLEVLLLHKNLDKNTPKASGVYGLITKLKLSAVTHTEIIKITV